MSPQHPGDAARRHAEPRHAVGAGRRGAVERAPAASARACAGCHGDASAIDARRRRPLPGLRPGAQAAGQPRAAHQPVPRAAAAAHAAGRRKARTAGAREPMSRSSRAAMPVAPPRRPAARSRFARARRGSCIKQRIGPAQPVVRAVPRRAAPASAWPATRSRRATPTATRSTAWSGRAWARCSGGCATA